MQQEKLSTVLDILNFSDSYLKEKKIFDSRLNAQLLMADVLNCTRMDLYLQFDKPLSNSEKEKFKNFLKRRAKGEPLQYILGKTNFYGYEIQVNKDVLIPRNDTEFLVEKFLDFYKNYDKKLNILEIGTGSGCIAVAVCNELRKMNIEYFYTGIDISNESLSVAEKNLKINRCENYNLLNMGFLSPDFTYNEFDTDAVISNPPYIPKTDYDELSLEVRDYEPSKALTDEKDGTVFFEKFFKLFQDSKINHFLEISYDAKEKLEDLMKKYSIKNYDFYKDYSGNYRVLILK